MPYGIDMLSFEACQRPLAGSLEALLGLDEDDVTFAMGAVDLSPEALAAVQTLADILDDGDGLAFEIQVLGHTDNVRLRSGSIYRSNVQLSAQRAISVRDAMVRDGVSPERVLS